ncbi:hypothetical protein MMKA1_05010 [Methanococcus maripaludis KA1]|jgi:hypothetical protein|uniref:Uncharacterized protein n=2 Tax=Methanococcus maripaludis TaxID=39152 RepID=A0A2Z5PGA9_METMI|nr:hypothetical protein [Methanococcus maripaludis]AEK19374.1 hypothetical protein GYY_02455 [Methanococcus maripaludis X1]BAP60618.1 hypothetical protein MMKA1_05010 [Methanococcus maripaludis KA1]
MGEICKNTLSYYDPNTLNRAFMAPLVPETRSKHYVKRMRDPLYYNYLEDVENWSFDKKYEFLDIMTDLVTKNYTLEEIKALTKKIYDKMDNAVGFEEISTLREKSSHIAPYHRKQIFAESLSNLKKDIHELSKINFQNMLECSEDFEKLNEFTILGSGINLMVKYIDYCLDDLKRTNELFKKRYGALIVFSLRFLAYLMDKITLEELSSDVSVFGSVIYDEEGIGDEDFEGICSFRF